ncbi:MAG TPA: 16S rRNA (adenine(1518)-N(6)/adenine(1519)-N(6))-dimethyltransferase RsmA [Candidatus Saccharimonadales bacterium]
MATGKDPAPRKSLGQHWLVDDSALQDICESAELSDEDVVLEIGPGTANLTTLLLEDAAQVIAVELDENLYTRLVQMNIPGLEVINEDILNFDFDRLPKDYKIVANIPYYLTGKLIRQISESSNRPVIAVMLVQKEIAQRMSAKPGDLSVLGLISQYFWDVQKGAIITADKFDPRPKVDSQVVILKRKTDLPLELDEQKALFRLIRIGFMSKRKTILNNLSTIENTDRDELRSRLQNIGVDPGRRPQSFSLDEWLKIHLALST